VNHGFIIPNLREIVCIFDWSSENHASLIIAANMAFQSSANLHVVDLLPSVAIFGGFLMMNQPTMYSVHRDVSQEDGYRRALETRIKQHISREVNLFIHCLSGARIPHLMEFLHEIHADLLLLGLPKKISWWERFYYPPVSKIVYRLSPCPVLSIPEIASERFTENYAKY
jgi:hypothetical protein